MIQVWEVDQNGNIIETYLWTQEEIDTAKEEGRKIIDFPWGEGFYSPKFDLANNKWVEGMTQQEIDALKSSQLPQQPTLEEIKTRQDLMQKALDDIILGGAL
jgi:hypothetical protein